MDSLLPRSLSLSLSLLSSLVRRVCRRSTPLSSTERVPGLCVAVCVRPLWCVCVSARAGTVRYYLHQLKRRIADSRKILWAEKLSINQPPDPGIRFGLVWFGLGLVLPRLGLLRLGSALSSLPVLRFGQFWRFGEAGSHREYLRPLSGDRRHVSTLGELGGMFRLRERFLALAVKPPPFTANYSHADGEYCCMSNKQHVQ